MPHNLLRNSAEFVTVIIPQRTNPPYVTVVIGRARETLNGWAYVVFALSRIMVQTQMAGRGTVVDGATMNSRRQQNRANQKVKATRLHQVVSRQTPQLRQRRNLPLLRLRLPLGLRLRQFLQASTQKDVPLHKYIVPTQQLAVL